MERSGSTYDLAGRRILVVEDEFFIAADLADALMDLGAKVVGPVPTRRDAIAALSGPQPVDLVVLDINLRGEMAFDVADLLMARRVPFVFATGYHADMIPRRFRDVPRWGKPYDQGAFALSLTGDPPGSRGDFAAVGD